MFDTLVASRAPRPRARTWASAALVGVLHAAVITVAIWATRRESVAQSPPLLVWNIDPWPGPAPTPDPDPGTPWSLPSLPQDFLPGVPDIPPLDAGPSPGVPVFVAPRGPSAALGSSTDTTALPADLVEVRPELLSAPVPVYPEVLRRLGVTGRVMVDVVVDTLGRVEPQSLRVVSAPHPGLVEPVRQALDRALFRPARIHGRAVRVLVRIPFEFRIVR